MKIEDILIEIRKGRRFRPSGSSAWLHIDPMESAGFTIDGSHILGEWEMEPELEVIKVHRTGHTPWLVSKDGWNCAEMDWELSEIDALKIAADKVRGIKDSPEYRDPKATEWYAAGAACNRPTRLDWYKKGHQAGWNAYEKARKEKS